MDSGISSEGHLQRRRAARLSAQKRVRKIAIDTSIIDDLLIENRSEIRKARREHRSPRIMVDTSADLLGVVTQLRLGGARLRRDQSTIVADINGTDWDIGLK